MTYSDIDIYLKSFGVETSGDFDVNSKWVYAKTLLANESDDVILKIADELEIKHAFQTPRNLDLSDSKFWLAGYFRLFLSHLSQYKIKATQLQKLLRNYGISAFVAHEDIEPTKDWQDEIEKALFSMDALAAILTPGFKESNWTDQEVGVAMGRDILIVPIRKGLDPFGFIAKYQGMQGEGKTIGQVADSLFQILANQPKTKNRMAEVLVEQILLTTDVDAAIHKLRLLLRIETLPERHLEKLRVNILDNKTLAESDEVVLAVNDMLQERGMPALRQPEERLSEHFDDDIPF
jgi:hypothetical protein